MTNGQANETDYMQAAHHVHGLAIPDIQLQCCKALFELRKSSQHMPFLAKIPKIGRTAPGSAHALSAGPHAASCFHLGPPDSWQAQRRCEGVPPLCGDRRVGRADEAQPWRSEGDGEAFQMRMRVQAYAGLARPCSAAAPEQLDLR